MSRVLQKTLVQYLRHSRVPCHALACPSAGNQSVRLLWNRQFEWDEDYSMKLWDRYDISLLGYQTYKNKKLRQELKKDQEFRNARYKALGPDLAAATFIIARGGVIKFVHDDLWYRKSSSGHMPIPNRRVDGFFVEGINASNMPLMLNGLDNIRDLEYLRYLKLSGVVYLTDWYLACLQRYSDTLEFLDISDCSRVTDAGIAALHSLRNLKVLNITNCRSIENAEVVCTFLQDLIPNLTVIGLDTIPKIEGDFVANEILSSRMLCLGERVGYQELDSENDGAAGSDGVHEVHAQHVDGRSSRSESDEVTTSDSATKDVVFTEKAAGHNAKEDDSDHVESDRKEYVNR